MIGLADVTTGLELIQDIVFENIDPTLRFTFEPMSARDVSGQYVGSLFEQNEAFVMFEAEIDDTRRAGPSQASPGRAYGGLTICLYTKNIDNAIADSRLVEVFSGWFAEKTVKGIRFRTFVPLKPSKLMGFTVYSGMLNFDFETQPKGMSL